MSEAPTARRPLALQAPRRSPSLVLVALVGGLVASSAQARPRGKDGPDPARVEERQQQMEKGVRERLAPELGLDQAQTDRLVETFREAGQARRAAHEALRKEHQALQALVERGASDQELQAQLDRVEAAQKKLPERGSLLDETRRFLTTQQQAKLAVLLPRVMKEGKHHRRGKRERRGGRGGPAGGFGGSRNDGFNDGFDDVR